ncbi:TRZ/ATZ family hydrolase [Nitrosomonas supralitoralis]|uniref:5-methylthioadenosine/S-adenosylhomocysteine deaminase n=1 Tax=Nitrosomonas supralitoralis TaxID=2116706 RepID=A0A2P7NS82_9PROT|nr:TRZ/ATZ family hydrolase [Nitrosomonas supralitoralis]PSJ16333.1 TRZ/ATZ family hydrolase [Nitrosomonas supralitoralis]
MNNREEIDTLIEAKWVIPVEPAEIVYNQHAIAINRGIIKDILPIAHANQRYKPQQTLTLSDHALIPGLINLHTHAAMTLMRGLADDLPLMEWLNKHIWPTENQHVNAQFVLDGTQLACAEMIKGGITCFNDMYFFPESCAQAAINSGMRAAIGMIVIDFPTPYASDADDYLAKGLELRDRYQHDPLLSFCFAPHAPYTVSDKTFSSILTYAEQLDAPIHTHLHETQDEIRISLELNGIRPLERMLQLGLLSPSLIAVHMVHLTDHEIKLVQQYDCSIAHCPSSNMKLASGFAPISSLVNQGVNIGLGTDGAASNNRLDMFEEMRLAALLAKASSGRADTLPAHQVLKMATLNGANALGLGKLTGSLAIGKAADITAINFSNINLTPCYDPISHLVYAASREHVSHVWANGRMLLDDKQLTTLDQTELQYRTTIWQERIATTSKQSI